MMWQEIETAPIGHEEVLVYVPRITGGQMLSASNPTGKQWWVRGIGKVTPTHWMRIAAPAPDDVITRSRDDDRG
jgi:hypothetical protein